MATAKTTKMASEYHNSSFSNIVNTNNTNTRFSSYKSNAFCAPRMGSLRLQAREPPASVHIVASATSHTLRANNNNNNFRNTTEQKLNTINLMKSIKSSQLAAAAATAAAATKSTAAIASPITTTKPSSTTTVNAFTLGNNKSYYSSTRSFSSKIVDKSKLSMPHVDKSHAQLSSSASSGTSSIESIVPKYNGFISGSKKRIYSSVRVTKKEMPSYHNDATVTVNSSTQIQATKYATTVKFTANKKQMKDNDNCRTIETITSNLCSSSSSSTATTTSSYSTKFPNGLPFEDEFYQKRRNSTSTKSEVSDYGSYENDDDDDDANDIDRRSLLPFEDEFSRQRPSSNDEALYVDFSKPIASKRMNNIDCNMHESNKNNNNNNRSIGNSDNNDRNKHKINETKSCSNRNYVCNPNEVIIRDQPVVYVAVQWWASANNCDHNTNSASHEHGHYDCNVAADEPIQTKLM